MSGAVFTLGNSVSGSLSLGSALSKFGRVAGQAGFTIEQEEETINNTVTSRYAGLAAVTVSGVTSVLNPSLVLIPSAYNTSGSTGILYSLHSKPNGVADFVVTRATEGTRFNSVGKISTVGSGDARLDYLTSGGTVGPPALLVEPAATNSVLQSQTFDVSGTWAPQNAGTGSLPSVTANAVISPDGTQNAETVLLNRGAGNTNGDRSNLEQSTTLATSGTYIFSVYAKATTSGDVGKQVFLRVGSAGTLTAYTLTANWVRLTRTETALASGSNVLQIGNRGTFTSDNSVSVDLWGAQLETGSVATSYIPTTTAAVTRNADVISVSGAVSGCIGQTEGTIYAEVDYRNFSTSSQAILHLFENGQNLIGIQVVSNGAINQFQAYAFVANSLVVSITSTISTAGVYKIALAYKLNDYALYINGTPIGTDSSAGVPTTSQVLLGHYASQVQLNNCIRAAALYTTRLTNQQLQLLTTL